MAGAYHRFGECTEPVEKFKDQEVVESHDDPNDDPNDDVCVCGLFVKFSLVCHKARWMGDWHGTSQPDERVNQLSTIRLSPDLLLQLGN